MKSKRADSERIAHRDVNARIGRSEKEEIEAAATRAINEKQENDENECVMRREMRPNFRLII